MDMITQEKKKDAAKTGILAAVIAVLVLILAAQTFWLFRLHGEREKEEVRRLLLESRLKREALVPDAPRAARMTAAQDVWDPFAELDLMRQSMNRMFQESFRRASMLAPASAMAPVFYEPDIDVQDLGDRYVIALDLPGMEKDRIAVSVEGRALTVSGERRSERESRDDASGFFRMERQFGSFQRTIPLPADAHAESLKAGYENGVLRIELAKASQDEAAKNVRKIPVE